VTSNGAKVLELEGYGIAPGCRADIVVLQASDAIEALRLRPTRLYVIRGGRIIAEAPPAVSRVMLDARIVELDFARLW
jgi:cytosine deaminase